MAEYVGGHYEKQPNDQVNDGDTGEQSRNPTHNVVKDGEQPEVFLVEVLLLIWRRSVRDQQISRGDLGRQLGTRDAADTRASRRNPPYLVRE